VSFELTKERKRAGTCRFERAAKRRPRNPWDVSLEDDIYGMNIIRFATGSHFLLHQLRDFSPPAGVRNDKDGKGSSP
jgi:hypothetical protein